MNLISGILIAGVLTLSGCSSIKKLDIFTMEVEREPLALEKPEIRQLEKLKWIIITSENADEVFKKMKDELSDILISELEPINKEIKKLLNEETYIVEILRKGSDKASDISQPILQKTREIVGFLK